MVPQGSLSGGYLCPSQDRKSTRLNSSHVEISYAVFCLKKKKIVVATAGSHAPCARRCGRVGVCWWARLVVRAEARRGGVDRGRREVPAASPVGGDGGGA